MPRAVKAAIAAAHYDTSLSNLRKWAREGAIPIERTPKGRYLYVLPDPEPPIADNNDSELSGNVIYARVSSKKQEGDLGRQAKHLKHLYPDYTLVTDIGSGINYKRKGFITILERLFSGDLKTVVVTNQDRFTRFGFDFFQWLFERFGAVLRSVEQPSAPGEDMVADIMEVFTVFTARYYGRRKYQANKKDSLLSNSRTKKAIS
jgi:predicted site-specific integrase-resolvase